MRATVEMPGGVRNLGWDFDRECVLDRSTNETEVEDTCSITARRFDAISASEGDLGVWDFDAGNVPEVTLGVDSALEAGRGLAPILDADRDADSILEAGRELVPNLDAERDADSILDAGRDTEDRDVDLEGDHGRDMSRRRDSGSSFSFSLSLKESLNASKNEGVRACTLEGAAADVDFPAK